MKKYYFLVAFGVLFHAGINNISIVLNTLSNLFSLISPIIIGIIIAFILNAPIELIEQKIRECKDKRKKKINEKCIHNTSLILTLICLCIVFAIAIILIIPNVINSVNSAYHSLQKELPTIYTWLESNGVNTEMIKEKVSSINLNTISSASNVLTGAIGIASRVATTTIRIFASIVIAIYILIDRNNMVYWSTKIICAIFPQKVYEKMLYICKKIKVSYFNFFTGQCIESFILSCMMLLTLSIFKIPYAALIAVLTGIFAFIPYVGAWLACGVGCVFIVLDNPTKALVCLVVYSVTQFIENQFVYPHVVGNKVGLSPLLTLASAVVGGGLFGIFGMIFFIPFVAVVRDICVEKLEEKREKKT